MNPKIMEGTYSFSPSGDYHSPEILEFKAVKELDNTIFQRELLKLKCKNL